MFPWASNAREQQSRGGNLWHQRIQTFAGTLGVNDFEFKMACRMLKISTIKSTSNRSIALRD